MPRSKKTATKDLIIDIKDLHARIKTHARDAGLGRYLGRKMNVEIDDDRRRDPLHAANVEIEFTPNHGLDHKLTTLVTDDDHSAPISSPERREELAHLFVEHMNFLHARSGQTAERRKAISRVAREVIEEAREQGIELELLRIETAPAHVYNRPDPARDPGQVFYVHLLMPHDDKGVLTEDAYTVDADDPEEFGDYVRRRVLPELVELKKQFASATAA